MYNTIPYYEDTEFISIIDKLPLARLTEKERGGDNGAINSFPKDKSLGPTNIPTDRYNWYVKEIAPRLESFCPNVNLVTLALDV